MSETLQQIGRKHGTDKHDSNHTYAGSTYLNTYERYMNEYRDLPVKILEIGVRDGCSHRMWREYFPQGTIYGIDIDPRCKQTESDRIRIFIGSQSDPIIINKVVNHAGGQFDIILDDGSHVNELTLKSFELLFPSLKSGGIYILEDMHCSYLNDLGKYIISGQWPGMQYNQGVNFSNDRKVLNNFFNSIVEDMDLTDGKKKVEWIHFYSKTVILKKM